MQTLIEVLEKWVDEHVSNHDSSARAASLTLREMLKRALAVIDLAGLLDLRIIDGALVALDTEEAEQIIMLIENAAYHDNSAYMSEEDAVNAILTACGIVPADERHEMAPYPEPQSILVEGGMVQLNPGDTITITRKYKEAANADAD